MTKTIAPSASRMTAGAVKVEALVALRDRLAEATGRDRELDEALALLAGWKQCTTSPTFWWLPPNNGEWVMGVPCYTASLSDAVTLVPSPNFIWSVGRGTSGLTAFCRLDGNAFPVWFAATPALAICRARIEYEIAKARESATRGEANPPNPNPEGG